MEYGRNARARSSGHDGVKILLILAFFAILLAGYCLVSYGDYRGKVVPATGNSALDE